MSLKTEDSKIDIFALFPKDADTNPVEGEVPPSACHELEKHMSAALAKIAPTDPNLPQRIGMREIFTDEPAWAELAGEACAGYTSLDPATSRPAVMEWATARGRPPCWHSLAAKRLQQGGSSRQPAS